MNFRPGEERVMLKSRFRIKSVAHRYKFFFRQIIMHD